MKKIVHTVLFAMAAVFSTAVFAEDDACDMPASLNTRTIDGVTYYEIGTCGDLYKFAEMVNGGKTAINGVLTADIVVNEGVLNADGSLSADSANFIQWTPMDVSFDQKVVLNGAGHSIGGLYFSGVNRRYVGLFGEVKGSIVIDSLGIEDAYFRSGRVVGAFVGWNCDAGDVTISNSYNKGSMNGFGR